MTIDTLQGPDAGTLVTPVPPTARTAGPGGPEDTAVFRRLLESLEQQARVQREQPPPADAEQLRTAIARVDDSFVTAMDLRRQLEAAFASRGP